jgi:hypothetical protein
MNGINADPHPCNTLIPMHMLLTLMNGKGDGPHWLPNIGVTPIVLTQILLY